MLGIPAGRGGEREREGRDRDRERDRGQARPQRSGGPRSERPPRVADAPPSGAAEVETLAPLDTRALAGQGQESHPQDTHSRGKPQRDRSKKPEAARKPQGPLVVVRRATGVVETRPLDAPASTSTPAPNPVPVSTPVPVPVPVPVVPVPVHPPSAAGSGSEVHPMPESSPVTTVAPVTKVAPAASSALFEEVPEAQSFAEMLESSQRAEGASARRHYRVGEKVSGTIFQLGADTAFVTLGGKSEAMIELRELKDDEGILRFGVGDVIEAHVLEAGARGIILSRQLAKGSASMALLAEARASGMPVEGMILAVNKGGLEVAVGDVRAFCPASQIDLRFVGKLDSFVGEKLQFRVMEVRDRNVVLSRRALLEEQQRVLAAETRKTLAEGKVVRGTVTGVRDFGAFVDLGGIEGMIPVSELSHTRVGHPSEVVNVGDQVEVEILRMEAAQPSSPDKAKHKERITLSMRSRQEDPFAALVRELKEGDRTKGKVVRLQPFGAFVELRPGVDGLVHISALSNRRIAHPRDAVNVGDEIEVIVEKVDPAEKRIGLRRVLPEDASGAGQEGSGAAASAAAAETGPSPSVSVAAKPRPEAHPRPRVGQVIKGTIDRIEPYGVFVVFPGGKGLVPASETGTERGTDLRRHYQLGAELSAEVIDIDASGKIRLSVTAAQKSQERAEMDEWRAKQPSAGGKAGFGTLGDLLKNKLVR